MPPPVRRLQDPSGMPSGRVIEPTEKDSQCPACRPPGVCQKCRSWLRDDRPMELVADVVCSELLDPLRAAMLERQLRAAFRSRQKASPGRTQVERRLRELHEDG